MSVFAIELVRSGLTRHLTTVELIEFVRTANQINRLPVAGPRKEKRP